MQGTWSIIVQSFWPLLQGGLEATIPLAVITFVLGNVLAFLTALARLSKFTPLTLIARFYVWVFRGTPLLVQLYIIFFGLPNIGVTLNPWVAAVIGFTLNVGAYNSEILRSAIQSVSRGQWEAGHSLGMTYGQTMRRIILPQAARVAVPPLGNSFIGLVKDTSLAATITMAELFRAAQDIAAVQYRPLLLYVEAAVIYLAFSTVLSAIQNRLEKRFGRYKA